MKEPADRDVLVAVTWNIERSGIDADGRDDRWHLAMDVLAEIRPHLFFRQELKDPGKDGGAALFEEAERLKLTPLAAAPIPESRNAVAVMADPDLFTVTAHHEHATRMWHPISNPVVRLRDPQGRPHGRPIHLASIHLCSHDPAGRATEAQRLTTLGDHGRSALFAGDMNSFVHRPQCEIQPFPDWAEIADSVYFRQRTIRIGDEHVPDTEPDRILAGIGPNGRSVFTELGHFAATELGQTEALQPTATLWRTDQGPPQRIDRLYSTDDIADALISVTTVVNDDVREASDHAPVVAKFSLPRLRHSLGLGV
ncbi:endonuclease/exonuclease/phosphatase family protein [Streptomyces sp. MP131-18]|uniref:endonuclease/exonuclease/phosphatase family protein n=1 Tax=Streptomyces sp. MP131-18 TaxID=1857892 RepID=UPI00097BC5F8|nr:endonuclease/exonuclease/phosphatase family protein [Streptomyces sp. MP131-18]ONK10062.1 Endonuclease/Exonuclease/phosphatase family protein [Streptomyces sp. MP131-18]